MIDYSSAELKHLAVHKVGNKLTDDGVHFSKEPVEFIDKFTPNVLVRYFLRSVDRNELYKFHHPSDIDFNLVYQCVKHMFDNPDTLHEQSLNIGRILYDNSVHPRISAGELCVCYFTDIIIDDKPVRAIGIFKSEHKDTILKFDILADDFKVSYDDGININKVEKGCIIFDESRSDGYRLCVIDNQKATDVSYWKESFLQVSAIVNDYRKTSNILDVAKMFLSKQITEDFEVDKAQQIDLLNKSIEYFKDHETFQREEFLSDVFEDPKVIESFKSFEQAYANDYDQEIMDSFEISPMAVKKKAKAFKKVLKLDKNFHVYIHGNNELIERCEDEEGRKFYKLYFEEES